MDLHKSSILSCSKVAALALIGMPLASCAGGSNVAQPALPAGGSHQVASSSTGTVPVEIAINRSQSANERSVMYVSPSTASLTVSVSTGTASPTTATANCTTTCSAQVLAPIGTDSFTVSLFDAANGSGHLLSTGTTSQQIKAGVSNSVALTLSGVIASVVVTQTTPIVVGASGSFPVTVTAKDAGNNTITGTYSQPITLAVTDSSNSVSLSSTSVTSSSAQVSLAYNGAVAFSGGSVTATIPGVAASAVTPASLTTASVVPISITLQ